MMLGSAFSTRENIMAADKHAIESDYRLLSFLGMRCLLNNTFAYGKKY